MPDHPAALLPCPWCGGKADWDSKPGTTGEQFWCMCLTDDCSFYNAEPFNTHARKTDAIAAWNRRTPAAFVPDPENREQIDAVARALFEMDKGNWVAPDYSQHEDYMRAWARRILTALRGMK